MVTSESRAAIELVIPAKGSDMYPLTRLSVRASLVFGLTLLSLGSGDLKVEATRGSSTTDWTRQPPARRADHPATKRQISDTYGRLPLSFEKNEGQTDAHVEFLSRGPGRALFLSSGGEAVFALGGTSSATVPSTPVRCCV